MKKLIILCLTGVLNLTISPVSGWAFLFPEIKEDSGQKEEISSFSLNESQLEIKNTLDYLAENPQPILNSQEDPISWLEEHNIKITFENVEYQTIEDVPIELLNILVGTLKNVPSFHIEPLKEIIFGNLSQYEGNGVIRYNFTNFKLALEDPMYFVPYFLHEVGHVVDIEIIQKRPWPEFSSFLLKTASGEFYSLVRRADGSIKPSVVPYPVLSVMLGGSVFNEAFAEVYSWYITNYVHEGDSLNMIPKNFRDTAIKDYLENNRPDLIFAYLFMKDVVFEGQEYNQDDGAEIYRGKEGAQEGIFYRGEQSGFIPSGGRWQEFLNRMLEDLPTFEPRPFEDIEILFNSFISPQTDAYYALYTDIEKFVEFFPSAKLPDEFLEFVKPDIRQEEIVNATLSELSRRLFRDLGLPGGAYTYELGEIEKNEIGQTGFFRLAEEVKINYNDNEYNILMLSLLPFENFSLKQITLAIMPYHMELIEKETGPFKLENVLNITRSDNGNIRILYYNGKDTFEIYFSSTGEQFLGIKK